MKKTMILILAVSLLSCNKFKHSKPETASVMALYVDSSKQLKSGLIYRVIKDTMLFSFEDSMTAKKKWIKDTMYFFPKKDTNAFFSADRRLVLKDYGDIKTELIKFQKLFK